MLFPYELVINPNNYMANILAKNDTEIDEHFGGLVVQKELDKAVKGDAIVSSH